MFFHLLLSGAIRREFRSKICHLLYQLCSSLVREYFSYLIIYLIFVDVISPLFEIIFALSLSIVDLLASRVRFKRAFVGCVPNFVFNHIIQAEVQPKLTHVGSHNPCHSMILQLFVPF